MNCWRQSFNFVFLWTPGEGGGLGRCEEDFTVRRSWGSSSFKYLQHGFWLMQFSWTLMSYPNESSFPRRQRFAVSDESLRKEGPATCLFKEYVSLEFLDLCLRISQFYFSMVGRDRDIIANGKRGSWDDVRGRDGYISGSELRGEYEAQGYKFGLGMKSDNSESAYVYEQREAIE
ncbi:hypothetical protein Tco_1353249 [Tanacetum coccineum]